MGEELHTNIPPSLLSSSSHLLSITKGWYNTETKRVEKLDNNDIQSSALHQHNKMKPSWIVY